MLGEIGISYSRLAHKENIQIRYWPSLSLYAGALFP